MIVSYGHRFIFIHVHKVAGSSLTEALSSHTHKHSRLADVALTLRLLKVGIAKYAALTKSDYFAPVRMRRRLLARVGHAKAKELKEALPRDVFDGFFKFTFVRNPWDWQVSIYHFVLQNFLHPDHKLFSSFGSFENYLQWHIYDKGVETQKEFVASDSGELLVDFIGHYETLQEDFGIVCNRLSVKLNLPHKNRSVHKDFREYYTPHTKALVAEAFREDIEFFGYQFDNSQMLPPILGRAEKERLNHNHARRG
jgi:hypothetical protein